VRSLTCLFVLLLACVPRSDAAPASPTLAFRIDEGRNLNSFLRDGPVAAHLLLRSGTEPRILVAFPAGNSAVGLWFAGTNPPIVWKLVTPPKPLTRSDAKHRPLRGIEFEIETSARELRPSGAVLSSVRVLRDYELQRKSPAEVLVAPVVGNARLTWARDRLDGAAGYRLSIEALGGTRVAADRFTAADGEPLRLRVQALTGETPLTPLGSLLTASAGDDARARDALAFLSYQQKFLAGSWRFDTYFGRDTLMSAMLLAPVLAPEAMESAIASVLDRLAPDGEVAHEEDIGEFAVLRNSGEGRGRSATPIYDYGMVDDDFMLAPLVARWLLDDPRGHARAHAFLAEKGADAKAHGAALARNFAWVVERAAAFANDPRATNLVGVKPGRMTGNWRDSEQGLGRGRYAYDVNVALVPAALDAVARLVESKLLDSHLNPAQRRALARAGARARAWTAHVPGLFAVDIPATRARTDITAYAAEVGVDAQHALSSQGSASIEFHALSLDEQGHAVPILNSDEGFRLLFTEPTPEELERCVVAIMRPFPAGLMTDVGLLVANPVFSAPDLRREFTRFNYHGTVVWSWQQALLAAGLERQLRRADLSATTRAQLAFARADLWAAIGNSKALRTSELWSWSYSAGQYHAQPFGRPGADVDESNAAQLWSTVLLGLTPPDVATSGTSPGN